MSYIFINETIKDENRLTDGAYIGTLLNIEEKISKAGDRMFKLLWKVEDTLINDYLIPQHSNDICSSISQKKMFRMAESMLGAKDKQQVDLMECVGKEAKLSIKLEENSDGNIQPRIKAILKFEDLKDNKKSIELPNDECPF